MPKKYPVRLTVPERAQLQTLLASGTAPARTLTHARILLKADEGAQGPAWPNAAIATAREVSALTVTRTRKRWTDGGVAAALHRKVQARRKAKQLDGAQEAHLLALACSEPPDGRGNWTLRLLAAKYVELGHADTLSYETVRRTLKRGAEALAGGAVVHPAHG